MLIISIIAMKQRLTREQRKGMTRELLLDAATTVFARRGVHGASVEEIATEAGFTTGAVYSNFSGKEDLFLALFERHTAEEVRKYNAIFAGARTLDEQARGGADEWMRELQREPEHFPLFIEFWAHAVRDPELRARLAVSFGAFRQAFGRMVQEGAEEFVIEVSRDDAERLGTVVNALGNGIALEKLADPEAVPDELLGTTLSTLFQSMLAAVQRGELGHFSSEST
jgi:AcrR family transcriptional regulator